MKKQRKRHSILTRFTVITAIALTLAFAVSYVLLHYYNIWCIRNEGNQEADYAKGMVQNVLGDNSYNEYFLSSDSLPYQELRIATLDVCSQCGADNLYLYTVNEDRTQRTYLFSVSTNAEEDQQLAKERSLGAISTEPLSEFEQQALDGNEPTEPETVKNQYGDDMCFYRRIELPDNKGYAILGLDYDNNFVDTLINEETLAFVVPMIVAVVCIAIMELTLLELYVVKPIRSVLPRRLCPMALNIGRSGR